MDSPEQPNNKPPFIRMLLERMGMVIQPSTLKQLANVLKQAKRRGLVERNTFNMLIGALKVTEMRVRDIMVPRAQITVISHDDDFEQILNTVTRSGHSRFPVIGEDKDELIGLLLAKDILKYTLNPDKFSIEQIMREAVIIPESKRLNTLLNEFRSSRNHMALVVDEYGGVSGLVSIEDVLEVIVGQIDDEHDATSADNILAHQKGHYNVNALTELDEFNRHFEVEISSEDTDTIGGYVMRELGHLPKRGEQLEREGLVFTVLGADSRRVYRLRVDKVGDISESEV